jgi:AcrR family transcriptional regulator
MKCEILAQAGEMFMAYGFKSVTMDDIAMKMGISKKTIYTHFKNKTKLIEAATMSIFEYISHGIGCICETQKNPIEELYAIKNFILDNIKDENSSSHYQLQKYYPNIFSSLKMKQLDLMQSCVVDNLKTGIELNLYRKELDLNFISRIYFNGVLGIKDEDTFPKEEFSRTYLSNTFLNYHIRAIATEKGIQILEKLLQKNEN